MGLVRVLARRPGEPLLHPPTQDLDFLRRQLAARWHFEVSVLDGADQRTAREIVELHGEVDVYRAQVEGESVYAFTVQSPGLWGTITGLIAVNTDGTRLVGIDFVQHSETPGLGGRIDEKAFQQQFRDERISAGPSGRIAVVSGQNTSSSEDSKVDAITGATRTSEAIQKLIDKAMNEVFPKVLKVVN